MKRLFSTLFCSLLLTGCSGAARPPLVLAQQVDLPRFMGDWYVIAHSRNFIENDAYNSMESYRLAADGSIDTTFTFRDGGFDGKQKRHTPRGFVLDTHSNAVWAMQFIWPIRSDFRIAYLAPDYSQTIIAREKRDYAWIMARTPEISETDYQRLLQLLAAQGYDLTTLRKVPQRWK